MTLIFFNDGGKTTPVFVSAGDLLMSGVSPTEWVPDRFDLSKLSRDHLLKIINDASMQHQLPRDRKKKDDLINFIVQNWVSILDNMKRSAIFARRRHEPKKKAVGIQVETEELEKPEQEQEESEEEEQEESEEEEQEESEEEEQEESEEEEQEESEEEYCESNISFDSEYLRDASDFDMPPLELFYVKVPRNHGEEVLTFKLDPENINVINFKRLISARTGSKLTLDMFSLHYEGKNLYDPYRMLSEFITKDNKTFRIAVKHRGGMPVMQWHLKQAEALKQLKHKVIKNITKKDETTMPVLLDEPPHFKQIMEEISNAISQVKMVKAEGVPIVKIGLEKATDAELAEIKELAEKKGKKNTGAEERIAPIMFILFKKMKEFDRQIEKMHDMLNYALAEMLSMFCDEFNQRYGKGAVIDMERFSSVLDKEIEKRENEYQRIRNAERQVNAMPDDTDNVCVIA